MIFVQKPFQSRMKRSLSFYKNGVLIKKLINKIFKNLPDPLPIESSAFSEFSFIFI
jgi:hypothetical protein